MQLTGQKLYLPLLLAVDSSAVEPGLFLFQILPNEIDLRNVTCKSKLLTEAERRKPPVSREADSVSDGINMAEPYLLQSTALRISYFLMRPASSTYLEINAIM